MSDSAGRSTALTLITPLRPGGGRWLKIMLGAARHFRYVSRPAIEMSFIHFGHWTVLERLPGGDDQPGGGRLANRYLFFESNYDDDDAGYIESFVQTMKWRMRALWGLARGNPGLYPVSRFVTWVRANATTADHYYCAYPEATTTMVSAALDADRKLDAFLVRTRGVEDDRFTAEYQRFLTDVQRDL